MKRMSPDFITQPVLSQGYTGLRICGNLFVNCKQNCISPNPARNECSPLQKWVITGHLERRRNGKMRSQRAILGLLHCNCSDTLIKLFFFAPHAVDSSWSCPVIRSSTPLFNSCSTTVSNFAKPYLTFQTDGIVYLHEYILCTRNWVYFAKFNTKLNIWPFCLQLLKQGFATGKWKTISHCSISSIYCNA